jgi:hypothetical protein
MEEALLGDVDAQQLGHLVEHDDEADAGLETGQHRRGDEIGDEAQAQHRGQHQQHADQGDQRGRRRQQPGRVAVGHRQAELCAGQDGQRGGGTDAEHARRAEQRIDHHRHQGRIQADGHRQAGDAGVGHGLGQHDCGRRESGNDVEAQPAGPGRRGRRCSLGRVHEETFVLSSGRPGGPGAAMQAGATFRTVPRHT